MKRWRGNVRFWRRGWVGALLWIALLSAPPLLFAHGGGAPQLTNAAAGPYVLSVWTKPDPPITGALHVTVALSLADNPEPITAAQVSLTAISVEDGMSLTAAASHEGALTPYFYEADLVFPFPGAWDIWVRAAGAEGSGEAAFTLDVQSASNRSTPMLIGGAAILLLAAAAIGVQRARRRGEEA